MRTHSLEIESTALGSLALNGFRVIEPGTRATRQVMVTSWLRPGANTLAVEPDSATQPVDVRIELKCSGEAESALTAHLCGDEWRLLVGGHAAGRTATFELSETSIGSPRLWSAADREPSIDRSAILEVVRRMHDAMSRRDLDGLCELLAFKVSELAQLHGCAAEELAAGQRAFFAELFEAPDWCMPPFDPDGLAVEPVAGSTVHTVRYASDGSPALRSLSVPRLILPIYVASFDGGVDWRVVR